MNRPDLETRVEDSVAELLRDVFPSIQVVSWSSPAKRDERCLAVMVEDAGEEIPCTGIHSLALQITGRNLEAVEREQLATLFGDAASARASITRKARNQFYLPKGEAVQVEPGSRRGENEADRVSILNLTISAQAAELSAAA